MTYAIHLAKQYLFIVMVKTKMELGEKEIEGG